jgi:hypothetical protein
MTIRTVLFLMFLMDSVLSLLEVEALTFEEERNKTIHFFTDTESLFKCEGGFYFTGQILAIKELKPKEQGFDEEAEMFHQMF